MSEVFIDPELNDYVLLEDGSPMLTNSLAQAAYIRLRAHLGRWLYDTTLGSELYTLKTKARDEIDRVIVSMCDTAMRPIIVDGRAKSITTEVIEIVRHARRIRVSIVDTRTDQLSAFTTLIPVG